jgi:hypothetical protein
MNHNLNARPTLWATLTLAAAVAASSAVAIANAEGNSQHHVRSDKAKSCSSSGPCFIETNTSTGVGIEGVSSPNAGVYGDSGTYYGVLGASSGFYAAVGGFNYDTSSGASGVYGQSANGPGVTGYSVDNYAMYAEGNVLVSGEIYTAGNCHSGCSKTRQVASFVPRTSQPTIDDVGESTLRDGVAHVALAADFANAVDARKPYVVLVTPEGEASLYVANRTTSGFDVRQIGGGHSSVSFAYRIVAKPYAVSDERLPFKVVQDTSMLAVKRAGR